MSNPLRATARRDIGVQIAVYNSLLDSFRYGQEPLAYSELRTFAPILLRNTSIEAGPTAEARGLSPSKADFDGVVRWKLRTYKPALSDHVEANLPDIVRMKC